MSQERKSHQTASLTRVVLIEVESAATGVEKLLRSKGYLCDRRDIESDDFDLQDYDLVILDLTTPSVSGTDLLRALWSTGMRQPVLILAGPSEFDHRVLALGVREGHCLTVPFDKDALIEKIETIFKTDRSRGTSRIACGPLTLDVSDRTVEVNGMALRLTDKEYALLELLCHRRGARVNQDLILRQLYHNCAKPNPQIIDVFIRNLRRKLSFAAGDEVSIESLRGQSYLLCVPAEDETAQVLSLTDYRASDFEDPEGTAEANQETPAVVIHAFPGSRGGSAGG